MQTSLIPPEGTRKQNLLPNTSASVASTGMSRWLTLLLACACGLIVANIYYVQPLISLIAPDIGLSNAAASLIVTLTQSGYCIGLLLLVPLGDLVENRRLISWTMGGVILALLLATVGPSAPWFLTASLLIGVSSVAVQMLVPIATHLAPAATRGRVVGNVMSGLLLGIMLARPVSSLVAGAFGWRTVFGASAALMLLLLLVLRRFLPLRRPSTAQNYSSLIRSLWVLLRDTPILRRRAAYQAAMFAAFSLYWTAVPLLLSGPTFRLTQNGIALFALAGAVGALSAPIAGRLADSGHSRIATSLSLLIVTFAFLLSKLHHSTSLAAVLAAGILLDIGVQCNLVLGQRAIFALGEATRSRLNGLYMAIFFAGGALGSAITSAAYAAGGWDLVSWIGCAFPVLALLLYRSEFAQTQAASND
ncbi:MFS transporter [Duganella violaceipulchra]|uniref:MFS family arabinose efflux permease n=2 Tax=Duganella violaceipulchra TaxID=2849652 RepID=A0ABT1GNP8_9BURK|nr:MFS transporter [Duganella violaceicalia]MCP2010622.1 putative MFS family arabinose efflux permease [Duganella violaceicalia]